jgi:hypothetical protein
MPMEPPPCGAAGIGVVVEHPRCAQEGTRTAAKPCCALLAEGLGTINVTLGSVIAAGLGQSTSF